MSHNEELDTVGGCEIQHFVTENFVKHFWSTGNKPNRNKVTFKPLSIYTVYEQKVSYKNHVQVLVTDNSSGNTWLSTKKIEWVGNII